MDKQAEIDKIMREYAAKNREIEKDHFKNMARIGLGTVLSGASAHPVFNIPYIGTGIGGAMYDLGQGIVEGDKINDLVKRAAMGFAIGETAGAIPYVGKLAGKTKAGQAIGEAVEKAGEKFAQSKAYDVLMSEFAPKEALEKKVLLPLARKARMGVNPFVKTGGEVLDNAPNTATEAFKKWFGNSKVVDEFGEPLSLYHGSVKKFDTFDKNLANKESDVGAGFYFTNSLDDVDANYFGGGPDFDIKVGRLADRLVDEEDIAYDLAEEKAREILMGEPSKIDAYLKMENPLYIGKKETRLFDYDDLRDEAIDQRGLRLEDFDTDDLFEEKVSYAIDDLLGEKLDETTSNLYDLLSFDDVDKVKNAIVDFHFNGGGSFQDFKTLLNDLYLEDFETGALVGNEVARRVAQNLGYDGIIDSTVANKFNMNLSPDTTHYIVFEPEQIKSVNNEGTWSLTDPNIYKTFLSGLGAYELAKNKQNNLSK